MSQAVAEDRGFNLGWALIASVAFHVLLALLLPLLPTGGEPIAKLSEPSVLEFTFERPTAEEAEANAPLGDVPFELPDPQPMQAPQSPPQPSVELTPDPRQSQPTPPPLEQRPIEQPREREPEPEQPREESDQPEGIELPEGDGYRRADTPRPHSSNPTQPSFDMQRALSDFEQALRRPTPESREREGDGSSDGVTIVDMPPVPSTGFGFGNLTFESKDFDWSDYARQIYMIIWRAWHNRLYQTSEDFKRWAYELRSPILAHQAQVVFTIEKNGQVTGIAVTYGSECLPLDNSAADALAEAILPPLPAEFPRDAETVHATFRAEGDVRTMGGYLSMMKRAGYF